MLKLSSKRGFSHLSTSDTTGTSSHDVEMQNSVSLPLEVSDTALHGVVGEELPSDEDDAENRPMLKNRKGPGHGCVKACLGSTQAMGTVCNNGVRRLLGWNRDPLFQARSIPLTGGVKLKAYLAAREKADPALLQALSIPNVVRNQKYHATTFIFQVS